MLKNLFRKKNLHPTRMLITGAPKSGTTALFYKIKPALDTAADCYFKEQDIQRIQRISSYTGLPVLAKIVLINKQLAGNHPFFSHTILLIWDPRDLLISALLYESGYHAIWDEPEPVIQGHLQLLWQKEENSEAVSVRTLWEQMATRTLSLQEFSKRMDYVKKVNEESSAYLFYYEDLIHENFSGLEDYLGFSLQDEATIPEKHHRVIRSKGAGNWRSWFTKEDVTFFKELFNDFMQTFYPDTITDWKLEKEPKILAEQSSAYVLRLINERRKHKGMSPIVPADKPINISV